MRVGRNRRDALCRVRFVDPTLKKRKLRDRKRDDAVVFAAIERVRVAVRELDGPVEIRGRNSEYAGSEDQTGDQLLVIRLERSGGSNGSDLVEGLGRDCD